MGVDETYNCYTRTCITRINKQIVFFFIQNLIKLDVTVKINISLGRRFMNFNLKLNI